MNILIEALGFLCVVLLAESKIDVCIPAKEIDDGTPEQFLKEFQKDVLSILDRWDTINLGHVDVNLTHDAGTLSGTLDDFVISKFADFNLCLLDVSLLPPKIQDVFNFTFTNIRLEGEYDLFGNIGGLFDISGAGPFWLEMQNLSIAYTDFQFIRNDTGTCVRFNLDVYLTKTENQFDGLFGGDAELGDLFNRAISAILGGIIGELWIELKETVDAPLENWINEYINKLLNNQNLFKFLASVHDSGKAISRASPLLGCFGNDASQNKSHR